MCGRFRTMLSQPPSRENFLPSYGMQSAAALATTPLRIHLSCRQPSVSRPHSSQGSLYLWLSGEVGIEETERHSVVSDSLQPHGLYSSWNSLEWVDFPFSRGSSQPRDWTQVSHIPRLSHQGSPRMERLRHLGSQGPLYDALHETGWGSFRPT